MSAGRPRKPTAIKEMQGTLQKCRTNPDEPPPSGLPMVAPSYLSDPARDNFLYLAGELDEIGVASSTFSAMLTEAATLMEMIQNCDIYLQAYFQEKRCYTYKTSNSFGDTIFKSVPEVGIKLAAQGKLKGYLSELGLGPGSISKVRGKKKEPVKINKFAK